MLFLLGVRTHPVVRVLTGAALLALGLVVGIKLLAAVGAVLLLYGAFAWYRRLRGNARREEARAYKNGSAR
jgi:hypothetical protein